VRRCAERFAASPERLDILCNNAGMATPEGRTRDGFQAQFGTNHLGRTARGAAAAAPARQRRRRRPADHRGLALNRRSAAAGLR